MIEFNEIKPNQFVKVLTEEDESWALVVSNEGSYLFVSYMNETDRMYKDATVYQFDTRVQRVDPESLMEHYDELSDPGIKKLPGNNLVFYEDVNESDSDSEIYSDTDSDDNSMIEEDDVSKWELPEDHRQVDQQWSEWTPSSEGGRHFKGIVDRLDHQVKIHYDNFRV